MVFDPRITPARADLAAANLKGKVEADRFTEGHEALVDVPVLSVWGAPEMTGALTTQLLFGETVTVFDEDPASGLAWVQNAVDGYVGYVRRDGLGQPQDGDRFVVASRTAQLYGAGALKSTPVETLPHLATVRILRRAGGWAECSDGRFIPEGQIAPDEPLSDDFVAVAETYLGAPYLWGGRSVLGLDCSALIQLSLRAIGRSIPRDSDMQRSLGDAAEGAPRRGDLVFWKGHVGIMVSDADMIHANAHHMTTVIEALADAERRIAKTDGPVIARRRLVPKALPRT